MHRHGRLRTLNEDSASVAQEACQVAGCEVEDRGGIAELGVADMEPVAFGAGCQLDTAGVIVATAASAFTPGTA